MKLNFSSHCRQRPTLLACLVASMLSIFLPNGLHAWQTGFLSHPSSDIQSLPLSWTADSIVWHRSTRGYGQSAPVIWNNQVYLTSVDGPNKETNCVTCLNLESGEIIWEREFVSAAPIVSSPMVSRAAPTAVCDDSGVFVFFESGELIGLRHSGETNWERQLQTELGPFNNKFGLAASLAHTDNRLIILIDHSGPSHLLAIDKKTGENLWSTDRGERAHSWTSPAIIKWENKPWIVVSSVGSVDVYDPATGASVAEFTEVGGNSVATPIDCGDGRFLVSSLIRPTDGPVEGAEKSNLLMRLQRDGEQVKLESPWFAAKARGGFSSPILAGNECYWITPQGVLYCLDAETGEQHYAQRLACGGCWATSFVWLDRVYCFGKDGRTIVVKAGPEFEVLADNGAIWDDAKISETSNDSATAKDSEANNDAKPATASGAGTTNPARSFAGGPTLYSVIPINGGLLLRKGDGLFRIEAGK